MFKGFFCDAKLRFFWDFLLVGGKARELPADIKYLLFPYRLITLFNSISFKSPPSF